MTVKAGKRNTKREIARQLAANPVQLGTQQAAEAPFHQQAPSRKGPRPPQKGTPSTTLGPGIPRELPALLVKRGKMAADDEATITRFTLLVFACALLGTFILWLTTITGDGDPFGCRDFSACPGGKRAKVVDYNTYDDCSNETAARRAP